MLTTLSRRAAICQSVTKVQLTSGAPLGAVGNRDEIFCNLIKEVSLYTYMRTDTHVTPKLTVIHMHVLIICLAKIILHINECKLSFSISIIKCKRQYNVKPYLTKGIRIGSLRFNQSNCIRGIFGKHSSSWLLT